MNITLYIEYLLISIIVYRLIVTYSLFHNKWILSLIILYIISFFSMY